MDRNFFSQPSACIKNNGYLSRSFQIRRGVKQGCPLSALLFIVTVEILSLRIKQNGNIKGFMISNGETEREVKISQYADDSDLLLSDTTQIKEAISEVLQFSNSIGPKLNINKTHGLLIGTDRQDTDITIEGITFKNKPIKCLGIYVGHNIEDCELLNWDNKVQTIRNHLDNWSKRDLTILGKIKIIRTLLLPKLTFTATNSTLPTDIVKIINTHLYQFIWGKRD